MELDNEGRELLSSISAMVRREETENVDKVPDTLQGAANVTVLPYHVADATSVTAAGCTCSNQVWSGARRSRQQRRSGLCPASTRH